MKRTRTARTKKQKRIQDKIIKPKVQEKFILSISGSNSEKAQVITKSSIWSSPAENKVKKFAFFTKGESKKVRYWMTPNLFIMFLNIPNPPIPENYFIPHKFYSDKYVSFHLNPAACSNMIYFMDKVKDVLSKNELFDRILLITEDKNIDELLSRIVSKSSVQDLSVNLNLPVAIPENTEETESDYTPTSSQVYKLTKEDGELDYSTTAKSQNQLSEEIKQLEENSESSPSLFISPPSSSDSKNNSAFKAASAMKDVYLESTSQGSAVSVSSSFRSSRGHRSSSVRPRKRDNAESNSNNNNSNRRSNRSSTNSTNNQTRKTNRNSMTSSSSRTRRNASVRQKNRNSINSKTDDQSGTNFESTSNRSRNKPNLDSTGSRTRRSNRSSFSPKNNDQNENKFESNDTPNRSRNRNSVTFSSSPLSRTDESRRSPAFNTDSYGSRRNQIHKIMKSFQEDEYYDYYDEEEEENSTTNRQNRSQRRRRRKIDDTVESIKSRNGDASSTTNSSKKRLSRTATSSKRKKIPSRNNYEEDEEDQIDTKYSMDSHGSRRKNRTQTPSRRSSSSSRRSPIQRSQNQREEEEDNATDEIDTKYSMDSHGSRKRKRNPNRKNANTNTNTLDSTGSRSRTRNGDDNDNNDENSTGSQRRHKRAASARHRVTATTITTTSTTTTKKLTSNSPSSVNTQRIKANRRSQSITNSRANNTYDGSSQPARMRNSIGPSSRTPSITFDESPTNLARHPNFASDHVRYNFDCSSLLSHSAIKNTNSEIHNRINRHPQTATTATTNNNNNNNLLRNDENSSSNDNFVFDLNPNEEPNMNNDGDDGVKEISVLKIVSDGTSSITKTAPDLKPKVRKRIGTTTQKVVRKSNSNFTKKITHTTRIVKNNSWNISIDSFDKPPLGISTTSSNFKFLNESTNPDNRAINSDDSSSEDEFQQEIVQKEEEAVEISDSIDAALPSVDLKPDASQKKE